MSEVLKVVNKLSENQDKLLAENALLKSQVTILHNQVEVLKDDLSWANDRLVSIHDGHVQFRRVFRSPDRVSSSVNATNPPPPPPPSMELHMDPNQTALAKSFNLEVLREELPPPPAASQSQSSSVTLPLSTVPEPVPPRSATSTTTTHFSWNHDAEQQSKINTSDRGNLLVNVLIELRKRGCINLNSISKSNVPAGICHPSNRKSVEYCLEFIQFVGSRDPQVMNNITAFVDRSNNDATAVRSAAEYIVSACAAVLKEIDTKPVKKDSCWHGQTYSSL